MIDIEGKVKEIMENGLREIREAKDIDKLNDVRVAFLGKKGQLTSIMKAMKDVPAEDRPKIGKWVNDARASIENSLDLMREKLDEAQQEAFMKAETIDVTLPAKTPIAGHRHPNTIALEEVERIFIGMGYEVIEGPEIEYDEYNFT